MVVGRDTLCIEVDIQVQAVAAGAPACLDVRQGFGRLTDVVKLLVGHADPGRMSGDAVEIEPDPA